MNRIAVYAKDGRLTGYDRIEDGVGDAKFICRYCDFAADSRPQVSGHISSAHRGQPIPADPFTAVGHTLRQLDDGKLEPPKTDEFEPPKTDEFTSHIEPLSKPDALDLDLAIEILGEVKIELQRLQRFEASVKAALNGHL